jgi:hypothetical protein
LLEQVYFSFGIEEKTEKNMEKICEKICGQNYTVTMRQCRKRSTEKEDCGTGLLA